jgi:hypothetical protein
MKQIFKRIPTPVTIAAKVAVAANRVKAGIHKTVVTPFLPDYKVIFKMYNVIPGQAIDSKSSTFNFAKGEQAQAQEFYDKMIASTKSYKVMPSEIQLVKRKRQVIRKEYFGPIQEIKEMMSAAK